MFCPVTASQPQAPLQIVLRSSLQVLSRELTENVLSVFNFSAGCLDTKRLIYFLIDGSSSIQKKHFEQIKEFMLAVIRRMFSIEFEQKVGELCSKSHKKKVEFDINDYNDRGN